MAFCSRDWEARLWHQLFVLRACVLLKGGVVAQLARLLQQLQDCEDLKEDLDEDEYETTKQETIAQLK
eukprot:2734080-Rhodomonas_salina.4